jgi:hypothetical protein
MKRIISAMLVLMFCAVVSAQQGSSPAQPTALDFKQPTASPEFSKFRDRVLGTWKAIETHEKRRSLPEGGSGEGTVTFTAGPGGLSVLENYRSKNPWGDFANHTVFWWDAEAGGMKSVGCETVHPECEVSEGVYKWEGDDLVARGERSGKMPNGESYTANFEERYTFGAREFMYTRGVSLNGAPMCTLETVRHVRGD